MVAGLGRAMGIAWVILVNAVYTVFMVSRDGVAFGTPMWHYPMLGMFAAPGLGRRQRASATARTVTTATLAKLRRRVGSCGE